MPTAAANPTVLPKVVFTIRTVTFHTLQFMIIRSSELSALWYIRSMLGHLSIGISYFYSVITITCHWWNIAIERILAGLNSRLTRNDCSQSALIRIKYVLLCHIYRLLLLLITWIVEIVAEENVIIINCMVQLLFVIFLLVLLITVVIHIVYLLTCNINRFVRINLRGHGVTERVPHHLRRTALDLGIKLVWLSNGTFMNLHWLKLLQMLLLRRHCVHSRAIHIEVLMINVRHLLILSTLCHHLHIMLIIPRGLMTSKLPMEAIYHRLLLLGWLLLRLSMIGKVDHWNRKVVLWPWLRFSLWRKGCIFKCGIIGMRVKS